MKSTEGFVNVQFSNLNANEKYNFMAQCIKINSWQLQPGAKSFISIQMEQVDVQLEALEKHKKLIREHREKEAKLRECNCRKIKLWQSLIAYF